MDPLLSGSTRFIETIRAPRFRPLAAAFQASDSQPVIRIF